MTTKRKIFIKKIVLVILIAAMLISVESACKYLYYKLELRHGHIDPGIAGKDVLEYPEAYQKDNELFWRLAPNIAGNNSLGFRDIEHSLEKKEDVFRIICIGDSITYGWPAHKTDTYPKKVAKILKEKYPNKNFEAFNLGIPGYSSHQGLKLLKKNIKKFQPDLVIAYYGVNDFGFNSNNLPDSLQPIKPKIIIETANFLSKYYFYKFLNKLILYLKYPEGKQMECTLRRVSNAAYKKNLLKMQHLAERNGAQIIFVVNPAWYDPINKVVLNRNNYSFPNEILYFDAYNFFKKRERKGNILFLDDTRPYNFHFTLKGQSLLARELVELINLEENNA